MKVYYFCFESIYGNGIVVNMAVSPALLLSECHGWKYEFVSFSSRRERERANYKDNKSNIERNFIQNGFKHFEFWRSSSWGLFPKLLDVVVILFASIFMAMRVVGFTVFGKEDCVIHARGYGGAMIGFCVAKISGAKFIFDPRGLFVEELSFEGKVRKGGCVLKF